MKFILYLISTVLFTSSALAQTSTVSGYIKDGETGETMIGVNVYPLEAPETGVAANEYGFYSIPISGSDSVSLVYTFIGYDELIIKVLPGTDLQLNVDLFLESEKIDEVKVTANSLKERVKSTQMSVQTVTAEEAKILPSFLGEVDIIKTLQLKPGISSGGEGTTGIFVRGGGPDQNLILLDEATIYNAQHLFGFFSTFNTDALKNVDLYKGGFPAKYGGRLSSVIDVKLKEGNKKKFSGSGGLGLISSRLTLEGPIVKNKSSFIVSGRRTYVDILTSEVNRLNEDNEDFQPIPDYYFYDLNTKVNYELSDKDKLFLSGYFGRDAFVFNDDDFDFRFQWGNSSVTARWNHLYSPKLFSNLSIIYANYNYQLKNKFGDYTFELGSEITDYGIKLDYSYFSGKGHTIKYGLDYTYHEFGVSRFNISNSENDEFDFDLAQDLFGNQGGLYFSDDYEFSDRLKMNMGMRFSLFGFGDIVYGGLEPRYSVRYSLNENLSIKASYARMYQYIHLVSNSASTLPTDIWYPSTRIVTPQRSDQVAAGFSWNINDKFLLTEEVYYKWQKDVIDFKDGAQLFVNTSLDEEFVFGKGYSYGNELYFEKTEGKLTGWVGYTLSWTYRDFEDINNGNDFFASYDRRHDVSVVGIYKLNKRINFSGAWVYSSGSPSTLAYGRYPIQDVGGTDIKFIVPDYVERNGFRLPAYHRLDLGMVIKFFPKWGESDLTINTYNTYNRRNPYFIYFDQLEDDDGNITGIQAKQVSLFPILPSITWNFKF